MYSTSNSNIGDSSRGNQQFSRPEMPPPPYFQPRLVRPSSFKTAINKKLDTPIISLFRLTIRLLQFSFALASGISYAVYMRQIRSTESNYIFAEIVFALTIIILVIDSVTVRYFRISWLFEWLLVVLWFTCFGIFYVTFLEGHIQPEYEGSNIGSMERAVWCNLVNALLWTGSALFSTAMCCTGMKAGIKNKIEQRRERKERKRTLTKIGELESGVVGATS